MEQLSQEVTTQPPSRTPEENEPCEFKCCSPGANPTLVICLSCKKPMLKSSFGRHAVKCADLPIATTKCWQVHRDGVANKKFLRQGHASSDPVMKMSFEAAWSEHHRMHQNSLQPPDTLTEHRQSSNPPLQIPQPTQAPDMPCAVASAITVAPDLPTPSQPTTCVPPAPQTKDDKLCVGIDELCET